MDLEKKEAFRNTLGSLSWDEVLNKTDTNEACNTFLDIFFEFFNLHFPVLKVKKNKKIEPICNFMTKGLVRCSNKKNDLFKKTKSDPSEENSKKYKEYRNIFNKVMKTAKKLHFCRRVRIAGDNPRILWDALKEITNLKKKTESIGTIRFKDQLIDDDAVKANIFNDYFADVGINTIKDLPTSEKSFEDYMPPP